MFDFQFQLLGSHDRVDDTPQQAAYGRPVDGGDQHLVKGLIECVGGEVPAHDEPVPGATPTREILQISPLDHPVLGVPHHGVLSWDEAPERGVKDHWQHEVDVVGCQSSEAIEQGTAEEEAAEGQLRALDLQEVLQLDADAPGQLRGEGCLRLGHGQPAAVVGEELFLQREATWRAELNLRSLRRGRAGPGLCEKEMGQREGKSHSSE